MQRRLSLLKQWSKERFRTKEKTETSEDFKALEAEIELRHVGRQQLTIAIVNTHVPRIQTTVRLYEDILEMAGKTVYWRRENERLPC